MIKKTMGVKTTKPAHTRKAEIHKEKLIAAKSYLPPGSTERAVAEVGAAAGGALLAAAVLGVGPAALAGAAGYLVYRETH